MEHRKSFSERMSYVFSPREKKGTTFTDRLILQLLGAEDAWQPRLDVPHEKLLIDMAAEMSRKMGLSYTPPILIYKSDRPNAASLMNGKIVFGTNLMETLTPDQVKAVIAHELAHHRHRARDWTLRLATTAAAVLGITAVARFNRGPSEEKETIGLGKKFWRWITGKDKRFIGHYRTKVILEDAAIIVGADLVGKTHQRMLEYEADREAGIYSKPGDMIGALEGLRDRMHQLSPHIQGEIVTTPLPPNTEIKMGLPLDAPDPSWIRRATKCIGGLFADHPPFEKRIERLRQLEAEQQAETATSLTR